jgi:5'-nucleotidase/UDP-sugar diphosphatase
MIAKRSPNNGAFFEVSGLKFRIKNHVPVDIKVAGKSLDLDKTYKIATNSFIARGGDGYTIFNNLANRNDTGVHISKAFMDYVRKHSPLVPSYEKRMSWVH